MAAPVRLEAEFFDDPDVAALATILGYEDRDTAAGKLARLFSWQTEKYTAERPTYAVPRSTLIGIFGARGPEAMVEAGLATLQAQHAALQAAQAAAAAQAVANRQQVVRDALK